jgi:lysyl-tRNA synthetase class 2
VIAPDATVLPFPFRSGTDLLALTAQEGCSIAELMRRNERHWRSDAEIDAGLLKIWRVMQDCVELARVAARAAGAPALRWKDATCHPSAEPERLTVREAFARHALSPQGGEGLSHDEFSRAIVRVEPHLGVPALTLLYEYPIGEAALARRCAHDPTVSERFELYACGVELANGFGELTDPIEQRARLLEAMDEKERRYGRRWPIDEDFLAALAQMPPASGVALGFDRLVMLATGARHIGDVLWTPPDIRSSR